MAIRNGPHTAPNHETIHVRKKSFEEQVADLASLMCVTSDVTGAGTVCDGYTGSDDTHRKVRFSLILDHYAPGLPRQNPPLAVAYAANQLWNHLFRERTIW